MKTGRCRLCQTLLIPFVTLLFANFVQSETTECTVITSLPYTISTQGVYCLKGHVGYSMTSGHAIEINTNNVVLDLNGYKIGGLGAGPGTSANGIYAYQRQNITIRNGTVRGFLWGIILDSGNLTSPGGHLIEGIRADMNTLGGIGVVGVGNIIRNNQVVDTGGNVAGAKGIQAYGVGNRVINNDVYETVGSPGAYGYDSIGINLWYGDGSIIENNRISNSTLSSDSCGVDVYDSANILITNNRIANMTYGIDYRGASAGKYRNNLTIGVTIPYTGGTSAGNNN